LVRRVTHRGVGHIEAGQGHDLGLELVQRLQRALGDLGLVGGVAGQELRALDDVVHRRRHVVAVGARAAEEGPGAGRAVHRRQPAELALHLQFAGVQGQVEQGLAASRFGHVAEQFVDAAGPDGGQHLGPVGRREGQVAHAQSVFRNSS
jgi:hypothetical protein